MIVYKTSLDEAKYKALERKYAVNPPDRQFWLCLK